MPLDEAGVVTKVSKEECSSALGDPTLSSHP
jgi:hypothetical protein